MSHEQARSVEASRAQLLSPRRGSSRWDASAGLQADLFGAFVADHMVGPPNDHLVITHTLGFSEQVIQRRGGEVLRGPSARGESILIPAGEESVWDGRLPEHVRIALATTVMDHVAHDAFGLRTAPTVAHVLRADDAVLAGIAELTIRELGEPAHPTQRIIIDSLATLMAAHLLRAHATRPADMRVFREDAGARRGIERAVDYIRARPGHAPSLDELAEVAGLSRFHFARMFRAELGVSPIRYVERQRMQYASQLLRSGGLPISVIAAMNKSSGP